MLYFPKLFLYGVKLYNAWFSYKCLHAFDSALFRHTYHSYLRSIPPRKFVVTHVSKGTCLEHWLWQVLLLKQLVFFLGLVKYFYEIWFHFTPTQHDSDYAKPRLCRNVKRGLNYKHRRDRKVHCKNKNEKIIRKKKKKRRGRRRRRKRGGEEEDEEEEEE